MAKDRVDGIRTTLSPESPTRYVERAGHAHAVLLPSAVKQKGKVAAVRKTSDIPTTPESGSGLDAEEAQILALQAKKRDADERKHDALLLALEREMEEADAGPSPMETAYRALAAYRRPSR